MINKIAIVILYHIFYEDSCEFVCQELKATNMYTPIYLFNICSETPDKAAISQKLKQNFPNCFIIYSSNKGKDIGAKLALLQLLLDLDIKADYLLFLHDKKSLQALKSSTWKKDLLKIVAENNVSKIINTFQQNQHCGIIATKEYILKEPFINNSFEGINGNILNRLLKEYNIKIGPFDFVAGTMFWARAKPLLDFFKIYNPIAIRATLEDGNVIDNFHGTITHSWERLLSWIITSNGYLIEGV